MRESQDRYRSRSGSPGRPRRGTSAAGEERIPAPWLVRLSEAGERDGATTVDADQFEAVVELALVRAAVPLQVAVHRDEVGVIRPRDEELHPLGADQLAGGGVSYGG